MPKRSGAWQVSAFFFFNIPDPGMLKTLESRNLHSTQEPWMSEQPSHTTGYPAIECCCHRWPAVQLQRASCQEGRVGPQEEMFLSSSNLFSTIKEDPAHTPTVDVPTQRFRARAESQLAFPALTAPSGADHSLGFKQWGALPLTQRPLRNIAS